MTTNRHQALGLSDEEAVEMYRTMLLARKIDERMWLLNRSGKIPFVVSCQGQEAAQVGAAYALNRDTDYVLPYYRDIGVVLAFGMTAKDLMMSGFAKAADPNSGGRQMPGHFGQKENRIVTGSSPVTTQVPHAVGIALAGRMDKKDIVSFVTFGEGSSNQGDFHEGANFAAVYKLPVIFMCENNKYAISVPYDKQVACEKISDRAAGYGMPGVTVDGNDLLEVYRAVKEARERASKGEGPTLIETVSYRLTPHSSDDDDSSYREREEVEEAKKKDPLLLYKAYLQEAGLLGEEEEKTMLDDIMAIVNEATDEAEKAPYAFPESTLDHVYAK
ncbi:MULTISPECIES: thiamine pyrophosphate-dependent dehydrogenase E1 component subunit alpha [Bacillus]|uniref:thiamine pyrophosphate-dependent dehydrogenase E1 component subunit alpha n=1 Tax=Bacillus TaxID=1386 RepID=UPI00025B232A|nr:MULTISPECIES: thiamine pyrophosphate-dependent dehydrogenase E1 component subunit alpha [Bacillus]EIF13830.1 BkdAA [Bacillus sp. 5B6]MEC0953587.1 thiamine pyrophosphate-dependent dehydrogenase E1 component subunit alpha [Bacillus velezensis]MED3705299.1 thiamine pyrophosphate-dependent dehydrogenase E1 component subunit alpha [Bacillus velezensis]QGI72863.1 thiamine pyrophosphate-dependent dehydrogenase E1 component subunit alpha [Bacillus velezensis]QNE10910.1 thiamine pyrophosphate-depend